MRNLKTKLRTNNYCFRIEEKKKSIHRQPQHLYCTVLTITPTFILKLILFIALTVRCDVPAHVMN